jgi:hypothetical protein
MDLLEKELGKKLSVSQVAEYLGVDARLVRRQYAQLGGVRLGPKCYIFFERRLINAISEQGQVFQEVPVDRANQDQRETKKEVLRDKKDRSGMGGRAKKKKDSFDELSLLD